MKSRSSLARDAIILGALISAIVAALQALMAMTDVDVGPLVAMGAAVLIALILTLLPCSR
jgi:hypothetical protein